MISRRNAAVSRIANTPSRAAKTATGAAKKTNKKTKVDFLIPPKDRTFLPYENHRPLMKDDLIRIGHTLHHPDIGPAIHHLPVKPAIPSIPHGRRRIDKLAPAVI